VVIPYSPPAVVQATPPAPSTRRSEARTQRAGVKGAKAKKGKQEKAKPRNRRGTAAAAAAIPRTAATSIDGMLLAGGLALFVLVLADTFLLTQASGVMRRARIG
jgi:hypothetical protein